MIEQKGWTVDQRPSDVFGGCQSGFGLLACTLFHIVSQSHQSRIIG
jgi:hypothetical protein